MKEPNANVSNSLVQNSFLITTVICAKPEAEKSLEYIADGNTGKVKFSHILFNMRKKGLILSLV